LQLLTNPTLVDLNLVQTTVGIRKRLASQSSKTCFSAHKAGRRRQQFVGKHILHLHCGAGALPDLVFIIELAWDNF
jgi:hypothetical protein